MTSFRTEVGLPQAARLLSYRRKALMVGSCFTENIGNHLQKHCFPVLTNPCGILYNPASMANCLDFLVRDAQLAENDLFFANGTWNNFHFHSRFSHPDKATTLSGMNHSLAEASRQLKSASHLFLTFGTSWIYRDVQNGGIVGNCHKLPANRFQRERLSVEAMAGPWKELLDQLFAFNPELHVVLTVSPIRHLKDGPYENQVSKSALFLLVDHLRSHFGSGRITYFPSYELVMDELRDYRFYAPDMLHLSEVAIAFIQEKFDQVFLDSESREILSAVAKLVRMIEHRPFQSGTAAYSDLLGRIEAETGKIKEAYPFLELKSLLIEISQKKLL